MREVSPSDTFFVYNEKVNKKYTWQAEEIGSSRKTKNWYITLGVVALGGAVASFIVGNILFSFLIVLGAFALALAGSRPSILHTYGLSDTGIHIDRHIIPWDKVEHFSLKEGDPYVLVMETKTIFGATKIPLYDIDYRAVRTEFKNNNVDEVDHLETLIENITNALGL